MRERTRDERGASVVEVAVASALLMLAMVPMMKTLVAAHHREGATEGAMRALNDGRVGVERLVQDVRAADRIEQATARDLRVWVDEDGDRVEDAGEVVSYAIDTGARTFVRTEGALSQVLARGVDGTFAVANEQAGDLVTVSLRVAPDDAGASSSTALRTEVLARNA